MDEIRDRGAELFVVGNGTPAHARDFERDRGKGLNLLVDPSLEAYAAAGLKRNVFAVPSPRSMAHAIRALSKGNVQGFVQGDPWQLGGAFVIDQQGGVVYEQVSGEAGDHADPNKIFSALDSLRGRERTRV